MKRKLVSMLLMISLVCSFNFPMAFAASGESTENTESIEITEENKVWEEDGITFTLDSEGTLTVSGDGPTQDYYSFEDEYSPIYKNVKIKKVIVEEGITRLGNEFFYGCEYIEEVSFPSTLTALGDQVFCGCQRIKTMEIPNHVTELGYLPFDDCRGLREFIVAEDHPTLSVDAEGVLFNKDKTVLLDYPGGKTNTTYDVPDGVVEIYHYAFDESKNLETVNLPDTLRTIGDEAFFECTGLTSIEIPEGTERLCGGTFQQCESLYDISLPKSLKYMNGFVFRDTAYYKDLENWDNYMLYIDSVLVAGRYIDEESEAYEPTGDIVIKEGTTLISGEAFEFNWDITSVTFPDSVKHIGLGAFYGCRGLVEVDLPKGLETLDALAFHSCTNLSQVKMGTNLTYIGYNVFEDTIYQDNENHYIDGILYNNGNLLIAGGTITADCTIKDDTRLIAGEAFAGKSNLTNVHIPDSVKYVCDGAFKNCDNLNTVTIPETVEFIGEHAFGYDYYATSMDEFYPLYNDFSIKGYLDTEAHRYAVANDIPFIDLNENPEEDGDEPGQPDACNHKNEVPYDYIREGCLEPGYWGGTYCGDCGETIIERTVLEPRGYHLESTLLEEKATCSKPGLSEGKKCSWCDEILVPQEIIPAYGHYKYESIPGYDATCTKDGLTDGWKCECGEIHTEQEVIPAGHKTEEVITKATTVEDGSIANVCTRCYETVSSTLIPKISYINFEQNEVIYDGEVHYPVFVVKDSQGNVIEPKDYYISGPSAPKAVGIYTYVIEFKNLYRGAKSLSMTIYPKSTSINEVWANGNGIFMNWTPVSEEITGYEIMYAEDSKFSEDAKKITINNPYDRGRSISNLAENTTYYVKIRTYKTVAGTDYYSPWSETVSVRTYDTVPETPGTPDEPENPNTPDAPNTPNVPDTPVVPDTPDTPVCQSHKWDNGKVTKPASCTETGITIYTCTVCGETETKDIGLKPHVIAKTEKKAATLKTNGSIVTKCACGEVLSTKTIAKIKSFKLAKTEVVYTGKAQKIKVTVKDSAGKTIAATNYTITYKNNTKVGKATATVKFKGNYSGTKSLTFKINPKSPIIKKPAAAKKAVTAKWSKVTKEVTGYEVMVATNKKFTQGKKTVTVKKAKATSSKVTKLKAKKTYYVRVRAYKTIGKVKYYSAWSSVKTVKTK